MKIGDQETCEDQFASIFILSIASRTVNVTVPSGISNNSDYGNKTTEDTVWRNGGNTTPQSA